MTEKNVQLMTQKRWQNWAWGLFAYTLLVILWGAWVRISHSGDGCGDTWPLCQGKLIPLAEQKKTWVEYTHRLMSGIYGILVVIIFAKRKYWPIQAQKFAVWSFIFMITEALLGAKLVLFGLVGANDSAYRGFVMALHQANSLCLSGSVFLLAVNLREPQQWRPQPRWIGMFFTIACTGAVASLASSLLPSTDLISGLIKDFSAESHWLLRARFLHPALAVTLGSYLAYKFYVTGLPLSRRISLLFAVGIVFGMATLLFLSPVWMKLVHLLLAHLLWSALLYLQSKDLTTPN